MEEQIDDLETRAPELGRPARASEAVRTWELDGGEWGIWDRETTGQEEERDTPIF